MSDDATPSAKLAALTVDRLIKSGLARVERRDALIAKIATGTMKREDWNIEIDVGVDKASQTCAGFH